MEGASIGFDKKRKNFKKVLDKMAFAVYNKRAL